ncbi:hypothetical protein WICMUC_000249 [Wickerhamomyces mucosus]|uniref:Large ribosomal subunit protein mL50 n=1 Tax=Wickerhamomyces mucosus TaxID=1378264 RepID=A0A9P8PZR6_9ASCO|nr:hypothetical protein WICMUC_000249 [Wickerhamomyces mucosus]
MLTRNISRYNQLKLIHTTSKNLGFMDWFNYKKEQEQQIKNNNKTAVEKPQNINEVISNVENNQIEFKKVEKIEFIGKIKNKIQLIPIDERLNGFKIDHWLNKEKILKLQDFEKLLIDTYNELIDDEKINQLDQINLIDLQLRFNYTLKIQSKSGYLIPDFILTKISTGKDLFDYFKDKKIIVNSNEINSISKFQNPLHLNLSNLKFTAQNISIETSINSKQRKSNFKKLLKLAKFEEQNKIDSLIQQAN